MQFFFATTVVYAATTIATNLESCCGSHLLLDYGGANFISYIVNSVSVVKTCQVPSLHYQKGAARGKFAAIRTGLEMSRPLK